MKYLGIIVVVIIILGGVFFVARNQAEAPTALDEGVDAIEEARNIKDTLESQSFVFADGNYELDTEASVIGWTGRRPLIGTEHMGVFELLDGSFTVRDGVVEEGTFMIDMQSLEVDGSGVANHLRSDDWFAVDTYPSATFVITDVSGNMVTGDLMIRETTHSISFPVIFEEMSDSVKASATFEMDRTLWDVTFGSGSFFSDVGEMVIDDNVTVTLDLAARPTDA